MESNTFGENSAPKINEVLKFALENTYSDFYRNKYKNTIRTKISSYGDFKKIPFLDKDEFLNVPIEKRTFVPEEQVGRYTISSGTTNQQKPAIIPNFPSGYDLAEKYKANDEQRKSAGAKRVIVLWPVLSSIFYNYIAIPKKYSKVIPGNVNDLKISAFIAKDTKIQGIVSTTTILYFFIAQLKEIGFDLKQIKWISLGGELCSPQKLAFIKTELPNAFVDLVYGSTETGPIGYRCDHLASDPDPGKFHPMPSAIIEIADENRKILPLGGTGELIYTTPKIKPFPLIRYRVKDIGSLTKSSCPCGNEYILEINGRSGYDVLKFHGVTLYASLIEEIMEKIKEFVEPQFQMHVFENITSGKIKPRLELWLKLKKVSKHQDLPAIEKKIAEEISNKLFLSAKSTLEQLVKQDIFMPLEIKFVEAWQNIPSKHKNIISHLG